MSDEVVGGVAESLSGLSFVDLLKYLRLVQQFAPEVADLIKRLVEAFSKPQLFGAGTADHCCLDEAIKAQIVSLSHLLHLQHQKCDGGECDLCDEKE